MHFLFTVSHVILCCYENTPPSGPQTNKQTNKLRPLLDSADPSVPAVWPTWNTEGGLMWNPSGLSWCCLSWDAAQVLTLRFQGVSWGKVFLADWQDKHGLFSVFCSHMDRKDQRPSSQLSNHRSVNPLITQWRSWAGLRCRFLYQSLWPR